MGKILAILTVAMFLLTAGAQAGEKVKGTQVASRTLQVLKAISWVNGELFWRSKSEADNES